MIIDDSKATQYMLQSVLKSQHTVVALSDGAGALKWLQEGSIPDLIIMDPDLPDQPDWGLVRQISTDHRYSSIPLVVLSDHDEEETRARVIDHGVTDFFLKPFNPISLMESVENILASHAMGPIY